MLKTLITQPAFPPGKIACTRGVHEHVANGSLNILPYLRRDLSGDWGDMCDDDKLSSNQGLQSGGRLMSSYNLDRSYEAEFGTDNKLWIITEWDRSVTTRCCFRPNTDSVIFRFIFFNPQGGRRPAGIVRPVFFPLLFMEHQK